MLEAFVLPCGRTGCYGTSVVIAMVSDVSGISIEIVHFNASDDDVDSSAPVVLIRVGSPLLCCRVFFF